MSAGAGRTDPTDSVSLSNVNGEVLEKYYSQVSRVNKLRLEVSTLRTIIQEKEKNIENLEKEFLFLENKQKSLTSRNVELPKEVEATKLLAAGYKGMYEILLKQFNKLEMEYSRCCKILDSDAERSNREVYEEPPLMAKEHQQSIADNPPEEEPSTSREETPANPPKRSRK